MIKNDNIIVTSCALVRIKNGMLITLAIKCIKAPNVADTCKTMKQAVTIKNDPIILPVVNSFIGKDPRISYQFLTQFQVVFLLMSFALMFKVGHQLDCFLIYTLPKLHHRLFQEQFHFVSNSLLLTSSKMNGILDR